MLSQDELAKVDEVSLEGYDGELRTLGVSENRMKSVLYSGDIVLIGYNPQKIIQAELERVCGEVGAIYAEIMAGSSGERLAANADRLEQLLPYKGRLYNLSEALIDKFLKEAGEEIEENCKGLNELSSIINDLGKAVDDISNCQDEELEKLKKEEASLAAKVGRLKAELKQKQAKN